MISDDGIELETVWDGVTGWHGHDYGRGALLPPYQSATTLTEATQVRPGSIAPAIRVQGHYSEEQRVGVRRMAALKIPLNVIAKHFQIPHATVRSMVVRAGVPFLTATKRRGSYRARPLLALIEAQP